VKPSRILLIGMMGVGKTTVGGILAQRLGWRYLDSDAEIVGATGLTVPEIFKIHGEAAFRAEESRVLACAATSESPVVIAVAGGAVREPQNRRWVRRAGFVVWLRASVETMAGRVGTGLGRPLLGEDPEAALRTLYPPRAAVYRRLADATVDVDHISPTEVAERALRAWHRRERRP
jgi:shikimate kinase